MSTSYQLPFRTRLVLLMLKAIRAKAFHKMSLAAIKRARKPVPRFFLTNFVLGRPVHCHQVYDRKIPVRDGEIRIRVYIPTSEKGLPIILNFHGGGWVVGNLQNNDQYCARLARDVGAIVLSVDYRLAPEHKFPVPVQDAYDALLWAYQHAPELGADPNRIGVTGDSAGGNLSAAISLMSRDLKGPAIAFQALLYPATDSRMDFASMDEHANAPILGKKDVETFLAHYIRNDADLENPYLSPVLAENLSNLPPALVVTAGNDPLRDDGKAYAKALKSAGNTVEYHCFQNDIHGFVTLANHSESGQICTDLVSKRFREIFEVAKE
ncbi:MAG TPA: alpha/beta hydrolase [Bacteroidetes bacterium]|nr:alpha/beta hydrolase [Bacteroidota bacterium]